MRVPTSPSHVLWFWARRHGRVEHSRFVFAYDTTHALETEEILVRLHESTDKNTTHELGGVISVGAGLPSEATASLDPKCKTPVLICAGSDQSAVTSASEDKLKRVFEHVEIKRYRKPGDSMPSNRDEMMPIMQFFSRRLKSTKGVPEGSVEIG